MAELAWYETRDQVATVTLDSPRNRNALTMALVGEMTARIGAAAADPSVHAVVLTHTGRVFCAGADLKAAGSVSMTESAAAIMAALTQIVRLPKPVIARITGHVRAGGMVAVGRGLAAGVMLRSGRWG